MKHWTFIAFILLVVASQEPAKPPERKGIIEGNSPQAGKQANRAKEDKNSSVGVTPAPNETIIYNQQGAPPTRNGNTSYPSEDAQIQRRIKTFTGWLVVVGLLQVAVLFMQWWMIRRQTEHFRNTERAWVMLMPLKKTPLWQTSKHQSDWIPTVDLQFQNYGRTPAWIVEVACRFVLVDKDFSLDYGDSTVHPDGEPVPPGEKSLSFPKVFEERRTFTDDDFTKIEFGSSALLLYGFIKYRDVFFDRTGLRETYFAFRYRLMPRVQDVRPEFWRYVPNPEANKHT